MHEGDAGAGGPVGEHDAATTRVNFHAHTVFSDGTQSPEVLAASLAADGVRFAALTDHDTVEGLARFSAATHRLGIATLPGLELTTQLEGRELHLVAYGFDPDDPVLAATLVSLRQARSLEVSSIAGSLRRAGSRRPVDSGAGTARSAAPAGVLATETAIAILHAAGGMAFLAHPLVYDSGPGSLEALVDRLASLGLDGLEAEYEQFGVEDRARLRELARHHGLLVSAGTDFHGGNGVGGQRPGIEMPREDWLAFRAALFDGHALAGSVAASTQGLPDAPPRPPPGSPAPAHRYRRRSFVLRIVLPTLAAMLLFLAAFWGLLLPSFEQTLMERKRETIRELTNSAWSILAAYEREERSGRLTREEAQRAAADLIEQLRYGPQGKDYFWIQDGEPRMIMHPYRTDLDGRSLEAFTDPRGVPIFVEFAALVERAGQGYVDYVWQWQDDPERLEPKESYVRGFDPWGWIIGTGLYTDDVRAEIGRLEQSLILAALLISATIAGLLLYVLQQSLRIERDRQQVVDDLHQSTVRYHALVEAATEGTLLVLDGHCRYANPTFLAMVGYTAQQLTFLELTDLLPRVAGNEDIWAVLDAAPSPVSPSPDDLASGETREGSLARRDGSLLECLLTLNPIVFDGQPGIILLARDLARVQAAAADDGIAPAVPAGVFRALASRRAVFLDLNPAARSLLAQSGQLVAGQPALADLFPGPAEFEHFEASLRAAGAVRDVPLRFDSPEGPRHVALSAVLVRDEQERPLYIDGLLVDVTAAHEEAAGRDALVERLQASLLFLHEPISALGQDAVIVDLGTSLRQAAQLMTERGTTAALVAGQQGVVVGIVTDHDLRARALAEGRSLDDPVHLVMTAPLLRIPDTALVYEALMRMEEHGVRHLAVEDPGGLIASVIDHKDLIQFPRYGPIVLRREIARATTPDAVARCRARAVPLASSLLESSARVRHITDMLTSIADATTERLVQLALEELGPAPTPFAFVAMGSQGRSELTLAADQDNGIVFAAVEGPAADAASEYFLRLGARVSDGLAQAGYPYCRGTVMASDPRWCRSLPAWRSLLDTWLVRAEPQDIADLSVLLDQRFVCGDAALAHALREHIHDSVPQEPAILYQLTRNALTFRPPTRLPGNIYLGGPAEHAGEIDLKDALMPIVTFARVYAARYRIPRTHTLERIDALAEAGVLPSANRDELAAVHDFLVRLRLQTQHSALRAGQPATSSVQLSRLGGTQRDLLRGAFTQIAAVQKLISYEFPEVG
jgi:signal-transduction protein with cAMP-binding, CBS, and nucleotidyltransferase domain/predicted metal-dependent phosphoesterase TrpH